MKKRLISILLAITMLASLVPMATTTASANASGSGTPDDPYLIYTLEELKYYLNNYTCDGKHFKLMNDITMNTSEMFAYDNDGNITGEASGKKPYQWTPVGTNDDNSGKKPFCGSFDGNGFDIIGIYINANSISQNKYQGLFGYCENAKITNLGVVGGYIKTTIDGGSIYGVGGVAGYVSGTVSNCYSSNQIICNNGSCTVGGIVGILNSGTLSNCYNTSQIICSNGSYCIGGVVGKNSGTVSNCRNTGRVSGSRRSSNNIVAGGVVGSNLNTVSYCYNTGRVSGSGSDSNSPRGTIGGVVGRSSITYDRINASVSVTNCYNSGAISGNNCECLGGVVGENYASSVNSSTKKALVSNCYNTGIINGSGNYIAGVVGYNYDYDDGMTIINNCYNNTIVNGANYVAGVVVCGNGGITYIENCYYLSGVSFSGESIVGFKLSLVVNPNISIGSRQIENITDLSDAQMRVSTNFSGFDFIKIWTMDGNSECPYPELIGMKHEGPITGCAHISGSDICGTVTTTCTSNGYTGDTYCTSCGAKIAAGEVIPALGHTGGVATCKDKAICTRCGVAYGELDPNNHIGGTEIRNQKASTCTIAGYTGNTYCKGCGAKISSGTTIPATGNHVGGTATCKNKAVCINCGLSYGNTNPNNHVGGTRTSGAADATCCENGYTGDTYCKGCGVKIATGQTIPATGAHVDADGKWETNGTEHWHTCSYGTKFDVTSHFGGTATCTAKAVCTACGVSYGELDITNHTGETEIRNHVDASCAATGYTGDTYCLGCGAKTAAGSIIKKKAHTPGEWIIDKAAGIGVEGSKHKECTVCHTVLETASIPAYYEMTISSATARAGENVTLAFELKNAPELKSIALSDFAYDGSALEIVGGEWKIGGSILSSWKPENGTGVITFASNVNANGVIFELTFKVKDGISDGEYAVSCAATAKHREPTDEIGVDIFTVPGIVEVVSIAKGDVDGDGIITSDDAIYLLYFTLLPDMYPVNQTCDFDGDGAVTSDDAIYLLYFTLLPELYPLK